MKIPVPIAILSWGLILQSYASWSNIKMHGEKNETEIKYKEDQIKDNS